MNDQIAHLEATLGSLETSFLLVTIPIVVLLLVLTAVTLMMLFTVLRTQRESEQQLLSTLAAIQKLQGTLSEQLGEQRRTIRTMNELLALKQAEMTGDFEIVEEPIVPPAAAPAEDEVKAPEQPLPKPASKFPPINLG
jgi:ABC-type siderophore export system fused ATPase/permease subunit